MKKKELKTLKFVTPNEFDCVDLYSAKRIVLRHYIRNGSVTNVSHVGTHAFYRNNIKSQWNQVNWDFSSKTSNGILPQRSDLIRHLLAITKKLVSNGRLATLEVTY